MYDKAYAQTWIENHESGKDTFRVEYLEPYFRDTFKDLGDNFKVLDVGCGWGSLLDFLKPNIFYHGVDITVDFFDYVKNKFPKRNLILNSGRLPDSVKVSDNSFDVCVCSQVLHTLSNLEKSIEILFSKLKYNGKLVVITFSDKSKEPLIGSFNPIEKLDDVHVIGQAMLPSGLKVHAEVYFHKEKDYEKEFLKYDSFSKRELGPLFVAYECIKK